MNLEQWMLAPVTEVEEVDLFERYLLGVEEGLEWFEAMKEALTLGEASSWFKLLERPLVQKLLGMSHKVLALHEDNFTPPERTPWGGYEIVRKYKRAHGVETTAIVGESWEVSGHPSFPSKFFFRYGGRQLLVPITVLEALVPEELYGARNVVHYGRQMPFLVKLLNSGSWRLY